LPLKKVSSESGADQSLASDVSHVSQLIHSEFERSRVWTAAVAALSAVTMFACRVSISGVISLFWRSRQGGFGDTLLNRIRSASRNGVSAARPQAAGHKPTASSSRLPPGLF